ncbi:hypothetical protein FD41_GL000611 [Lentilactobacillus farraginis DSM 18382 = JCM 14108]|uniref:Uncharacterized protein n=1 Tax=Lentilactobacillus farraginis DSM 18382 = JCM 14108 TaxID=1423743 RepID=X0PID2_9LACO|nr:hypothetical protein FD41_GL000611 [Lentilactobacillus farraginis DSM 18382 = JCM 14108]GAF36872.1 hypothetical protein JCM14108_1863 [Lentilactobacillus farraginis DSM 18382 = JCM 14108]
MGRKAVNFQSVIELSEYSGLECLDNLITWQEVAIRRTFSLSNNREHKKGWTKLLLSQPCSYVYLKKKLFEFVSG